MLYEVITHGESAGHGRQRTYAMQHAGKAAQLLRLFFQGAVHRHAEPGAQPAEARVCCGELLGRTHRITSYNVCYTKLLRNQGFDDQQLILFSDPFTTFFLLKLNI